MRYTFAFLMVILHSTLSYSAASYSLQSNLQHVDRGCECVSEAVKQLRLVLSHVPSDAIVDALVAAKKRGVDVEVILDHLPKNLKGALNPLSEAKIPLYVHRTLTDRRAVLSGDLILVDHSMLCHGEFRGRSKAGRGRMATLMTDDSKEGVEKLLADYDMLKTSARLQS